MFSKDNGSLGRIILKTQLLKTRSYLLLNFAVTKVRVVIHLDKDGKEWTAYSFNYPLAVILTNILQVYCFPLFQV